MPFIESEDTAEITVQYRFDAQDMVTVFHVHDDAEDTMDDFGTLNGLAEDVWNQWDDHVMPHLSANVQMVQVLAQDIGHEGGKLGGFSSAAVLGGQAGQSLPANVSLVIRKRSGLAGRNSNGAMRLPGVTEGNWPGGASSSLPGAFVAAFNADLAAVLTGLEDGTRGALEPQRHMCVLSRYDGHTLTALPNGESVFRPTPRASGIPFQVLQLTCNPKVGTMRRRLLR